MPTLKPFLFIILLSVLLISLPHLTTQAAAPPFQKSAGLFEPADNVGGLEVESNPTIIRSRLVNVNFNLLGGAADSLAGASQPEVADVVTLNLFDDVTYTAVLDRVEVINTGGYAWIGHVVGDPYSLVVFVVNHDQTAGNVAVLDGFYSIRYVGSDTHAIYQLDHAAFPDDIVMPASAPDVPPPVQALADDGSQIDVMVLYTSATRQAAGGVTAIQNQINLAVTETNQSYANSAINQRLRLVHTEEVNYAETGDIGTDLNRLTSKVDGYMDNAHTLRDTHKADLVALIVEQGGSYCGIANLMTNVSSTFESLGFSVTARGCATGYYSFGHELGHNMGARHDRYVDPTDGSPFTYNHGYVDTTAKWRTVMAYNNQCNALGSNCTRLPYWSNPGVNYNGAPTGQGAPNATDNHLALNNTAFTIANFRNSGSTPTTTGPLVYDGHTIDDNSTGDSLGNNNGLAECGEKIESFVTLYNQGSSTATGVNATLSTSSPYVTFLFNTNSAYLDIPGSSSQPNSNDFDFQVAANTPNGHQIEFTLNITAGNGGPWSASFVVPVTCNPTSGDSFETDNNNTQAQPITSGLAQAHSIYPSGDEDWVVFTLTLESGVLLETSGTPGDDTRMWLYDNDGVTELNYNDDIDYESGIFFSRIERQCETTALPAGTYYVKVDEYYGTNEIAGYSLSMIATPCGPGVYLPIVIK